MFKKISISLLTIVILLTTGFFIYRHFFNKKVEGVTDINSKIISTPTQTPEPQPTEEPTQQATAKPKPVYQPTSEPTPEPTNTQNPPSNSQDQINYNYCIQIVIDNYNKGVAETNRSIDEYITRCGSLPNAEACIEGFLTLRISQLQEWEMFNNNGIAQCAAKYPNR